MGIRGTTLRGNGSRTWWAFHRLCTDSSGTVFSQTLHRRKVDEAVKWWTGDRRNPSHAGEPASHTFGASGARRCGSLDCALWSLRTSSMRPRATTTPKDAYDPEVRGRDACNVCISRDACNVRISPPARNFRRRLLGTGCHLLGTGCHLLGTGCIPRRRRGLVRRPRRRPSRHPSRHIRGGIHGDVGGVGERAARCCRSARIARMWRARCPGEHRPRRRQASLIAL